MTAELPNYMAVSLQENGSSFPGVSFDDYRMLARTALSVTRDVSTTMAIYKLPESGCCLDIFTANRCLTIQVNSSLGSLCLLLSADIDSADEPLCILSVSNTEDDWRASKSNGEKGSMKLIYNAIIGGKFYVAGEPIERSMVPPGLRKYEAIDEEATGTGSISLSRKYNQVYSVDDEGRMSRPIRRQIAQMQIEAERNDALEEEVADAPLDETTAAALEKAQEDYAAGVEQQKANARIAAEHADEAENAICEEHDLAAEKGEFDEYDSDPRPKPKPPPSRKLFVKRQGKFLPISTVYPLPGETLYRHRKRGFGVTEKFIKHSVFKEESNNEEIQVSAESKQSG